MTISHPASRAIAGETPVSTALGAMWALLTVVIWSAWPSYTRLSITTTLSAPDLVALRYAIGGLLFLPVLIHGARRISPRGWREGLTLAFLQGAPLAMLVTLGLRFAPAGHMAALSPGLLPLFAASVGYVFLNEPLSSTRICAIALIGFGALALVFVSVGCTHGVRLEGRCPVRVRWLHGRKLCGSYAPIGSFRTRGRCAHQRLFDAALSAALCHAVAAVEQSLCRQSRKS